MTMRRGIGVWLCRTDRWTETDAQDQILPWLDATERARWSGFVFNHDRHLYLTAHGLLRRALSDAVPGARPADWAFETTALGRPVVAGPARWAHLAFSLAHTPGMAAVAIGMDAAVGIDVERLRPADDGALAAAAAAFTPGEQAWIGEQGLAGRSIRTLRLWALKEAYAKARGLGLHLPLDSFAFTLGRHRGVTGFAPPEDDRDGRRWRFIEAQPGRCRFALAYRGAVPMTVNIMITDPGSWTSGCAPRLERCCDAPDSY